MISKIFGELFAQQLEELGCTSDKTTFDDIFDDIVAFFEKRFNIAVSVEPECSRRYGLADASLRPRMCIMRRYHAHVVQDDYEWISETYYINCNDAAEAALCKAADIAVRTEEASKTRLVAGHSNIGPLMPKFIKARSYQDIMNAMNCQHKLKS